MFFCVLFMFLGSASSVWISRDFPDIIDMSHRLKEGETLNHPTYKYTIEQGNVINGTLAPGIHVEANEFKMIVHTGTHMDAPCHFCKDPKCWRMHEVPFENLFGPAVVIDVSTQCNQDPNYEMSIADINEWQKRHGPIPKRAMIMVMTGGQNRWPDWVKFWGVEQGATDLSGETWPGVASDAAKLLIEEYDMKGIGMDWGVIDSALATRREGELLWHNHRYILGQNRLIFEYVANIDKLPPTGYTIYAMPLKLYNTCGSPLRMIAVKNNVSGAATMYVSMWMMVAALGGKVFM